MGVKLRSIDFNMHGYVQYFCGETAVDSIDAVRFINMMEAVSIGSVVYQHNGCGLK